jgi:ribosomal protein S18 acetylase RimI-like enzyme
VKYNLRWMVNADMEAALTIEKLSFEKKRDRLLYQARNENQGISMVAECPGHRNEVVGFMVYAVFPNSYQIISLAVDPKYRRSGVARAFHEKLRHRIEEVGKKVILAEVNETNLGGQLFFKAMGYLAVRIRNPVPPTEASYVMQYSHNASQSLEVKLQ